MSEPMSIEDDKRRIDQLEAENEKLRAERDLLRARLDALDIRPTRDGTGIIVGVISTTDSYHPAAGPIWEWLHDLGYIGGSTS